MEGSKPSLRSITAKNFDSFSLADYKSTFMKTGIHVVDVFLYPLTFS